MRKAKPEVHHQVLLDIVKSFVANTSGLVLSVLGDSVTIQQKTDDKKLTFLMSELSDVLTREDKEGKTFIQVNFRTGRKILLTDSLVGFKPENRVGLDLNRLPKVVTTPDLLSVFEAIEEILNSDNPNDQELEVLREVYYSILCGGEAVGFDLSPEKIWLSRLMTSKKASA
ncbi:MAG TPA: hypothetical protein VFV50_10275 [Bdellovibrionales bacterium]|nr:hypothetical protein [Bdellovibrionales bacterium]